MLYLVMVTYNDWLLIKNSIDPVLDYIDHLIVVDGVFTDFPVAPGDQPTSTDGTIEYIIGLDVEKTIISYPGLAEVEKRNQYLLGAPGDWYLHLDADERVENPESLSELPDADIGMCQMRWVNRFARYPRLFRHIEGLHYEGLHHRLVDADGNLFADIQQVGDLYKGQAHPLRIRHDIELRSDSRKKQKAIYYKRLTKREHEIKEQMRYGLYAPEPHPVAD